MIFELYLNGLSVLSIIRELEERKIKSPIGKDVWSKRIVQKILENEKYMGHVLLGKTSTGTFPNNKQLPNPGERFLMKNAHEPIIEEGKFEQVQAEMKRRSNIEIVNGLVKRKETHYSSKRKTDCETVLAASILTSQPDHKK